MRSRGTYRRACATNNGVAGVNNGRRGRLVARRSRPRTRRLFCSTTFRRPSASHLRVQARGGAQSSRAFGRRDFCVGCFALRRQAAAHPRGSGPGAAPARPRASGPSRAGPPAHYFSTGAPPFEMARPLAGSSCCRRRSPNSRSCRSGTCLEGSPSIMYTISASKKTPRHASCCRCYPVPQRRGYAGRRTYALLTQERRRAEPCVGRPDAARRLAIT